VGINEEQLLVNVPGLQRYESSRGVKPVPSMQVKAFRNVIISDKRLQLRRKEGTVSQELRYNRKLLNEDKSVHIPDQNDPSSI
jgi:hypothetical protein